MSVTNRTKNKLPLKRRVKNKYSVGEIVLCYEPDPVKAKVLYSSKIIEIVEKPKKTQHKYDEYLIHFQGWNSTWDRYVTDDFLLKDTPDNRKLQETLASEAQLTTGGNLYKRNMSTSRKRSSSSRRRSKVTEKCEQSVDLTPSNSNCQPSTENVFNNDEYNSDKEQSSDDEGDSGNMYFVLRDLPPRIRLYFPPILKKMIGYDEYLIKDTFKLITLPANPSVISILEQFTHYYVTQSLPEFIARETERPKYEDLITKVNLCKESVDGFRIIFDFTVENLLLYNEEKKQFTESSKLKSSNLPNNIETAEKNLSMMTEMNAHEDGNRSFRESELFDDEKVIPMKIAKLKPTVASSSITNVENFVTKSTPSSSYSENGLQNEETAKNDDLSNKSICLSSGVGTSAGLAALNETLLYNSYIKKMVAKELKGWKIIPDSMYSEEDAKPSLIYGATHLARLFVKLPEIIQYSTPRVECNCTIIEYSDALLKFLSDHPEWFGDHVYTKVNVSPEKPTSSSQH